MTEAAAGADANARLARLEARAELADLVAQYCTVVDDRDLDGIVALFTGAGRFGHDGAGEAVGRDAIRAVYRQRLSESTYSFHYPHTHLIRFLSEGLAEGVVSAHAEMGRDGRPPLRAAMRYFDTYEQESGRWRFSSRMLRFWYFAPVDEIDGGALGDSRVRWPGKPRGADLPDSLPAFAAFKDEVAAVGVGTE